MEISHLRLMSSRADTERLIQAANVIGISQPAVSRLVTKVELDRSNSSDPV
jgi:DNA-binding transcriptional LysR family regulator